MSSSWRRWRPGRWLLGGKTSGGRWPGSATWWPGRDDSNADQGFGAYSAGAARVYNHSVPEFASSFGPLELVPPGVADTREWRPGWEQAVHLPPRDGQVIVGVARVG